MNTGTLYQVNAISNANDLGRQLSDYGKWIYYEYALNEQGPITASSIPGHVSGITTPVMGAIQEGIWLNLNTTNGNIFTASASGTTSASTNLIAASAAAGGLYASGWDANAYLAYATAWEAAYLADTTPSSSTYNSDHFETAKQNVEIAQLVLSSSDGSIPEQNQMVWTITVGSTLTPEPATAIVWALLGAASCLGVRVWRRRA